MKEVYIVYIINDIKERKIFEIFDTIEKASYTVRKLNGYGIKTICKRGYTK
jgi:hypothetical protein